MNRQLRTGIDLIEVGRIEKLNPEIRQRFLERVYTAAELAICQDRPECLAGRFSCKEAVAKALGTGIGEISWQEIEILADERHMPVLTLHGKAESIAAALGLNTWSVSISHIRDQAVAIAVAMD